MRFDDDALERAILSQGLEEPPPDLRAAILASTVYRPAPPFSISEIVLAASLLGVLLWLGITWAPQIGMALVDASSNLALLLWLAAGVAVTVWIELLTGSQPLQAFARRARGRAGP